MSSSSSVTFEYDTIDGKIIPMTNSSTSNENKLSDDDIVKLAKQEYTEEKIQELIDNGPPRIDADSIITKVNEFNTAKKLLDINKEEEKKKHSTPEEFVTRLVSAIEGEAKMRKAKEEQKEYPLSERFYKRDYKVGLGGKGISFSAIFNSIDENRTTGKQKHMACTLLEDILLPYAPSKREKIIDLEAIEICKEKGLPEPKQSPMRPPMVFKKGDCLQITTFAAVMTMEEEILPGCEVTVTESKYSIITGAERKHEIKEKKTEGLVRPTRYKVLRGRNVPYISIIGAITIKKRAPWDILYTQVSNSRFNKENYFNNVKITICESMEEIENLHQFDIELTSTTPTDVLYCHSLPKNGLWVKIDNTLPFYDPVPANMIDKDILTLYFAVPKINPERESLSKAPEYLCAEPGDIKGTPKIPCIREDDGNLCGETLLVNSCYIAPIYDASRFFRMYNPTRWVTIAPTLWQATIALAWLEINILQTLELSQTKFSESFKDGCFYCKPSLVINYQETMLNAGLRISREFAFKLAINIQSTTTQMALPKIQTEEEEEEEEGESSSKRIKLDPNELAKKNEYWISSIYANSPDGKAMESPSGKKRVVLVSLLEVKGHLDKLFVNGPWEYFAVPPYPLRGGISAQSPLDVFKENNFYTKNSLPDCIQLNETFIKENWNGVYPEIFALRKYISQT